jgi:DME family drug/metabolite transporter
VLLVSSAGVVWGTIGPAVQLAHEASGLSPWVISGYRAVAAVLALLVAVVLTRRVAASLALARRRWRRVTITGVATAIFQLLFFVAVIATGVSVTTVIALGLAPVLLLVVGSVERRQAPGAAQVATVSAALVGLGLVSFAGGGGDEAPETAALGVLAAFGSGTAYAVATHAGAPLSREHSALAVTTVTTSVAACVLVPGGLVAAYLRGETVTTTDAGSWLLLTYLGVVTMAFAYVLLYAGLRSTTSGSAVVATLLEPVTAVLIAVLLLGERPTAAVVIGTVLILAAIASLGRQVEQEPQLQ